jgi:hypothetical protein
MTSMRFGLLLLLVAVNARADVSALTPSTTGTRALGLERAHGPYSDLRAYLADFERVDPRGLYLFNGNEGECDHRIDGLAPLAAAGLEVQSVTVGGGNGECHLAIRRRPDGAWYFLESGGAYSGRSDSTIRRVTQVQRAARGAVRFLVEVDYRRWWHEDHGEEMTGWYLCRQLVLACRAEPSGAFACSEPLTVASLDRCFAESTEPAQPPPRRRWDYALHARLTGDALELSVANGRHLDPAARKLLEGTHPLVFGAGAPELLPLVGRPRNSEYWKPRKEATEAK